MATDLDPLHEYANHWLRHAAIRIERPRFLDRMREWIADIERGRPGFASAVRSMALDALAREGDVRVVRSAVGVLAVVGRPEDVGAIARAAELHGGHVQRDARTAVFEIQHPRARHLT